MSKRLPYFKFFVNEWITGDISLESYDTQGVFISICAYYWSKECDLTTELLNKKFKGCEKEINILIKEKIIKIENDIVTINFLNEQKNEFTVKSLKNKENGKKGGRPKSEIKPNALFSLSETKPKQKPLREDKIREDNIREESEHTHTLNKYINQNYPTVSKLKTQLTNDEAEKIKQEFSHNAIIEILEAMENKADLLKKYKSVNLTLRNWIKTRRNSNPSFGVTEQSVNNAKEWFNGLTNDVKHMVQNKIDYQGETIESMYKIMVLNKNLQK